MIKIPKNISNTERKYLEAAIDFMGDSPSLEAIWSLMDQAWHELECSHAELHLASVTRFYTHPVWLLNGLFIEQHEDSLNNRRVFTEYIAQLKPRRIADFGGGFGTLARMIGEHCTQSEIHVVEPHPHPQAIALANETPNVRYVQELSDKYDVLIATDVFEHVHDPLALVENTASHLCMGGKYLIANCFWPVILCHLPSTFHFRYSWNAAMVAMNLQPEASVSYGKAYNCAGPVASYPAREVEHRSQRWFELIEKMPKRARSCLVKVLFRN